VNVLLVVFIQFLLLPVIYGVFFVALWLHG